MSALRIATRSSKLALWQAEHVAQRLRAAHPGLNVELVPMTTQGDRVQDRSLAEIGGKGLFIKELEVAIARRDADIAVHSMKDVPADLPVNMILAAFLERADPRDAFVSQRYASFADLPPGARLGTSSVRRQSQLRHLRSDVQMLPVRGNVDTRLRKLDAGEFDAIVLASAGLTRLGLADRITEYLSPQISLPAVGQGIIGIECREDDQQVRQWISVLNDLQAQTCIAAERAFAAELQGNCQSPIGAYAQLQGQTLQLDGLVASLDGSRIHRDHTAGRSETALALGRDLAKRMLAAGAGELLQPALPDAGS
jgi:hydroxymethylbilane synthase